MSLNQTTIITLDPIPDIIHTVDEPYLLLGKTNSTATLQYEIISGTEHAVIVDEFQINALSPGTVTIRVTAPEKFLSASVSFSEATEERTFQILQPTILEMKEAQVQQELNLNSDIGSLLQMAAYSAAELETVTFKFGENQGVEVNGTFYQIHHPNTLRKFMNRAPAFYNNEIAADQQKLRANELVLSQAIQDA